MNQDHEPKIILTRPEPGLTKFSGQLAQEIPSANVYCEALQVIDFIPYQGDLTRYSGFVFTSSNGVRAAKRWNLPSRLAFGVGKVTTELAHSYCDPVYDGGSDVEALIALIESMKPDGPLLHIRGRVSIGNLATRLSEYGIETHEAIGYEQNVCAPSDELIRLLRGGKSMILPLFSPKSAEILKTLSTNREHWHVIAMSHAVAEIFDADDVLKLEIAQKPNGAEMLNCVVNALRRYVV
jgi:uroporphyrinogen-III synthase